jgi:hypothetical protein
LSGDPRGLGFEQKGEQEISQREVAKEIGRELKFESVNAESALGRHNDACVSKSRLMGRPSLSSSPAKSRTVARLGEYSPQKNHLIFFSERHGENSQMCHARRNKSRHRCAIDLPHYFHSYGTTDSLFFAPPILFNWNRTIFLVGATYYS